MYAAFGDKGYKKLSTRQPDTTDNQNIYKVLQKKVLKKSINLYKHLSI